MHQRQLHTRQMATLALLVLAALALSALFGAARDLASRTDPQDLAALALFWQTGVRIPASATESETTVPQTAAVPEPEPVLPEVTPEVTAEITPVPLTFTSQEAESIAVGGACSYSYDKADLLLQPVAADFTAQGPLVLIVHTHTTESYTRESGQDYTELTHARTLDDRYNMIRVGQQVAARLEAQGIGVIHDTTVNDYPNYNGAYDRMKAIIEENLAQYPTIQMVLDIHRDAAADANGDPLPLTASFADGDHAQLMLVVGTDQGGLYHPNWQQNLSTGLKLQALLERTHPGLCRNLNLRQERFNQNQTPCSLLIEFGTDGNTLSQALLSADALGDALAELILAPN